MGQSYLSIYSVPGSITLSTNRRDENMTSLVAMKINITHQTYSEWQKLFVKKKKKNPDVYIALIRPMS